MEQAISFFRTNRSLKASLLIYSLIFLFLSAGVLVSDMLLEHGAKICPSGWGFITIWAVGLAALLLQKKAGLPQFIDHAITKEWRYVLPIVTGVLFALPDVIIVAGINDKMDFSELPPYTQPFPYSIFLYYGGAFWVDVVYKLVPVTLIMLVCHRFLNQKAANIAFWVLAVLLALVEPLEQFPTSELWYIIYSLGSCFAFNLIALYYYKKAGWFAALLVRLAHYTIWHIALGAYVEFVMLG